MARRVTKSAAAKKSRRAANKTLGRSVVRATSRQSSPSGTVVETRRDTSRLPDRRRDTPVPNYYRSDEPTRSMPDPRHSVPRKRVGQRKPAIDLGNR